MRQFVAAVGIAVLLLPGCGGPREMGSKAPAFGGNGKFSTTAGFLDGRWKAVWEKNGVRKKETGLVGATNVQTLEFRPDHTCVFRLPGSLVHMTWKDGNGGIDLAVVDVDGNSPDKVETEYTRHKSDFYRRRDPRSFIKPAWAQRSMSLGLAQNLDRLELMPDKKRLCSAKRGHLGEIQTWVRLAGGS